MKKALHVVEPQSGFFARIFTTVEVDKHVASLVMITFGGVGGMSTFLLFYVLRFV
jgi:hypothetical protein